MKGFAIKGKKILIAKIDDKFYAMDSVCSHRGADLSTGKIEGNCVVCPWHHAKFDIATGKVTKKAFFGLAKMRDLDTPEVSVKNEKVYVKW